jgi:hypothetical protein
MDNMPDLPPITDDMIMPVCATAMMCVAYCADKRNYGPWVRWQRRQMKPSGLPQGPPPSREGLSTLTVMLMALAIQHMTEDQKDLMDFIDTVEGGWKADGGQEEH